MSKKRLSILTILGLLAIVTCLPFIAPASASGFTAPSISLSYSLSRNQIFVTVSSTDSGFPSQVVVTLASSFNGSSSPYNVQNALVPVHCGKITITFAVPYAGVGDYSFSGTVKTISGTTLVQGSLDPRIDPDWR